VLSKIVKLLNKNQKGFTLVELLVALVIAATIGSGVSLATYQVFNVNSLTSSRMVAVKQVERGVDSIRKDVAMNQSLPGEGNFNPLVLNWIEWDATTHRVAYSIIGGKLTRQEYINSGYPTTTVVANYIDSTKTSWKYDSGGFSFTLTCTVPGFKPATESRTFQILSRSN
jgi:prepilin-type N-terminal cleavage/methylation domain-containing protein